jgi:hypothetical protein
MINVKWVEIYELVIFNNETEKKVFIAKTKRNAGGEGIFNGPGRPMMSSF